MSRPVDLQRIAPIVAVAVVAVLGLFLVSRSLGGSEGGSKDAEQVLQQAFSGEAKGPQNSRVRGNMSVSVAGPAGLALTGGRPVTMQIKGIVNGGTAAGKTRTSFDVDMTLQGGGQTESFGFVSTGRRGFVEANGRAYEIPQSELKKLSPDSKPGVGANSAALAALDIDPGKWVTNVTDAGTEQVGGEATTHVTADIVATRFFADVLTAAERTGQASQIPPQAQDLIRDSVKQAKLDVYVAKRDGTVRKLALTAQFEAPNPGGGDPGKGDFRFDLEFTEVGKPQRIVAPRNAAPLSELDDSDLDGFGGLGTLQGTGTTPKPGTGGRGQSKQPSSGAGKKNRASTQAKAQSYVTCVQQAQDVQALSKCQSLVP